jgi:hypothetical protein
MRRRRNARAMSNAIPHGAVAAGVREPMAQPLEPAEVGGANALGDGDALGAGVALFVGLRDPDGDAEGAGTVPLAVAVGVTQITPHPP